MDGAILVGHSYGGMVITGVADRLAERLAHLVYLDASVPLPGESWASPHPAHIREARRQRPQPGGVYEDPLVFDAARVGALPRTFIDCTAPALETITPSRERARTQPGWRYAEIATGHDAMISAPAMLLELLYTSIFF